MNRIGGEAREVREQDKAAFEEMIALLKDIQLVEDPPGSGWFEFADPGMLPFLQSMSLGYRWALPINHLSHDDPLWQTCYWCVVHLTDAQGHWQDHLGRFWTLEQLRENNALIRRNHSGIESVTFPLRIDEAGNAIYPPDRTIEHRAGRTVTQAPESPAGEQQNGYGIF